MDIPGWRVLEDHAVEPNILATDETYHHRTEIVFHFIPAFFGCNAERNVHASAFFISFESSLRREPVVRVLESTATGSNLFPLGRSNLGFLQWTPIFAVSIDGTLTGDSHVLQVSTRDRRLAATGVKTFERGFYERIEVDISRKEDDTTFFDMQVDVAFQCDRTCKPYTLWNNQFTTAFLVQCINRFLESISTKRRTIADSSEILEVNLVGRELRACYLLHLEWKILVKLVIIVGFCCL